MRNQLIAEKEKSISKEHSEIEAYDKGILLLNTGAIGSSFLLLNTVFKTLVPESEVYLVGAWSTFALSATFTVASHLASAAAFSYQQTDIDQRIFQEENNKSTLVKIHEWFVVFLVKWLNRLSLLLFIVGAALLLWFAKTNVGI